MVTEPNIYLDFNSTTPVDPLVLEAMLPWFTGKFANAASITHIPGREAAEKVEKCRSEIAGFIGCEPGEVIFTSGSTESINMSIKGVANQYAASGNHIITWKTEHKAVLDVCNKLRERNFEVTFLDVNREGLPDLDKYKQSLRDNTILTIMMLANNETGVINPVREFADVAHTKKSLVLCDATQGPGKMRVDVNELGADLLCISAHKMYGPKGIGALFVRRKNPRVALEALLDGGGHEKGLRSGTLNVPGIVGMARAAELAMERYWDDTSNMSRLRTLLEQQLTTNGKGYVNGSMRMRLPNTANIMFPGLKASALITRVPELAIATGSACNSALPEASHVLKALGLSDEEAYSSIRFSLGRTTTDAEIESAVKLILKEL